MANVVIKVPSGVRAGGSFTPGMCGNGTRDLRRTSERPKAAEGEETLVCVDLGTAGAVPETEFI